MTDRDCPNTCQSLCQNMRLINVNTYLKAAPGVHLLGKLVLNMFLEIPLLIWNYVYVYIYIYIYEIIYLYKTWLHHG